MRFSSDPRADDGQYDLPDSLPPVCIIIPTRDRADLLRACIDGLIDRTRYPNPEILVVDNDSKSDDTHAYLSNLQDHGVARVLRYPGPFNYAAISNRAAETSDAEILLFLNNDTSVIHEDWLSEMVSLAVQPAVGCVGAKLLYADDTIQHAGIILGGRDFACHAFAGRPRYGAGRQDRRQVSAVTGACLAIRRESYEAVGGMDEKLPVAYNDIDLCLKVEATGCRNVFTPFAELYHYEAKSRGRTDTLWKRLRLARERRYMRRKWGRRIDSDPYFYPESR